MNTDLNITVITVTYGNRWGYLESNLSILENIDLIKNIIVVNNGSSYEINGKLEKFHKSLLVNISENSGSARGFSYGIKTYLEMLNSSENQQNIGEWVLFLDDDNYIKEINEESLKSILNLKNVEKQAYICKRLSRDEYFTNYQSLKYNSFLGFSCFNSNTINSIDTLELLPYSGLLLKKEIIEEIGLPNEDLYLYCDDYEYTFRLAQKNIVTKLIDSCIIDDLEVSWNKENENFAVNVVKGAPLKVYYSVRNRVYFERNNAVSNNFIFFANAILFLGYVVYKNLRCRTKVKFKSLYALILGIKDGLLGRLGVHKKYKLN